jgi:hypothetical protein
MIIKLMAIIRCPYCHAIIDENDKYCNNCGTQLLFSEDDEVEEEIPGEKIINAETEEKDYTVDEPKDEKRPAAAKDLDSEIDADIEEELREETEETALDELVAEVAEGESGDVTEEVILVDEIEAEAAVAKGQDEAQEPGKKEGAAEIEVADKEESKEKEREKEEEAKEEKEPEKEDETRVYAAASAQEDVAEEEPAIEYVATNRDMDEAATAGESALRPITFDTKELEDIGKTVDLGKEEVDKFIEVMAEKKPEEPAAPKETDKPATGEPPTGTLPPWASTMKGAPVFLADTGPVETRKLRGGEPETPDTEEEVEIFPRRRDSDSTIGLPEKVSQVPLPFERGAAEEEEKEQEEEGVEGETREAVFPPADETRPARPPILPVRDAATREPARPVIEPLQVIEEAEPRPPFSFSVFFKSKAFDVLFVGLFWLVALWLAAYSMGLTLFEILGSMSGSMLLLYAVLVFLYFFLFKFFLGETLGDRLFRRRE